MELQSKKIHITDTIAGLFKTGFFHIIGAGSLNKILMVLLSIVLVRTLSKADYGAYAYAYNIVSFFVLFNGFGVTSAALQICSELYESQQRSDTFFGYAYKSGIVVDCFIAVAIIISALAIPLAIQGSNELLVLYCFYPLLMLLCDIKLVYLRTNFLNREYAFATNLQTILLVVFSIIGACLFAAPGLIIGQSLAYLLCYLYLCIKFPFRFSSSIKLTKAKKIDFWGIAGISAFNNGIGHALTLVGTFFVGLLLTNDELVANYQVATYIPFGLLFIPSAVMTYCYPYFARNRNDRKWTLVSFAKVIVACLVCMVILTVMVIIFADYIVYFLFGELYLDIVPTLRILMVGFCITASFRLPVGNLLVTQRKLFFNSLVGVFSIAVCVISSLYLIPSYGLIGAAIAYDITMLFGAVLNVPYYVLTILKIPEKK